MTSCEYTTSSPESVTNTFLLTTVPHLIPSTSHSSSATDASAGSHLSWYAISLCLHSITTSAVCSLEQGMRTCDGCVSLLLVPAAKTVMGRTNTLAKAENSEVSCVVLVQTHRMEAHVTPCRGVVLVTTAFKLQVQARQSVPWHPFRHTRSTVHLSGVCYEGRLCGKVTSRLRSFASVRRQSGTHFFKILSMKCFTKHPRYLRSCTRILSNLGA